MGLDAAAPGQLEQDLAAILGADTAVASPAGAGVRPPARRAHGAILGVGVVALAAASFAAVMVTRMPTRQAPTPGAASERGVGSIRVAPLPTPLPQLRVASDGDDAAAVASARAGSARIERPVPRSPEPAAVDDGAAAPPAPALSAAAATSSPPAAPSVDATPAPTPPPPLPTEPAAPAGQQIVAAMSAPPPPTAVPPPRSEERAAAVRTLTPVEQRKLESIDAIRLLRRQ